MFALVLRPATGYASPIVASNYRRPARQLRVIGGEWRGRRWQFPAGSRIRPTPDRVRETLFNWLAGHIVGARVLDLFAGSGALGLEAHSRGAAHVTFVERDAGAARSIGQVLQAFGGTRAEVCCDDALRFLERAARPYDIVFLDPPFDSDLPERAAAALESGGWLADPALLYLELPARTPLPALPPAWQSAKSGRAGDVGYHLVTRAAGGRTARGAAEE